jgi:hypothetical protein
VSLFSHFLPFSLGDAKISHKLKGGTTGETTIKVNVPLSTARNSSGFTFELYIFSFIVYVLFLMGPLHSVAPLSLLRVPYVTTLTCTPIARGFKSYVGKTACHNSPKSVMGDFPLVYISLVLTLYVPDKDILGSGSLLGLYMYE